MSRRIRLLLAAVALMVAMITASAAPAVALDDLDVELFPDGDDICATAVGEEEEEEEDDNDVFDDNGDDNSVFDDNGDDNSVFDDSTDTETETECEDIEDLLGVDEAGFVLEEEDFLF